jgi:hypothetical protein
LELAGRLTFQFPGLHLICIKLSDCITSKLANCITIKLVDSNRDVLWRMFVPTKF